MFPSPLIGRKAAVVILTLLATLCAPACQANLFGSLFSGRDENERVQEWAAKPDKPIKWGEWDQLSLEKHTGAPNSHPVQLSVEQIAEALASIQIQAFRQIRPLFSEGEVRRFSLALALALAKATPEQDVVFVSTGEHEEGLTAPTQANSGRVFYAEGRINILIGLAHHDFLADLRQGSQQAPKFATGSRNQAARDVKVMGLRKGDAKVIRNDWIAITPPKIQPKKKLYIAPANAKSTQYKAVATPTEAAPVDDETYYKKQESRLRSLQKMYEQGLINEVELKAKRAAVLGDI